MNISEAHAVANLLNGKATQDDLDFLAARISKTLQARTPAPCLTEPDALQWTIRAAVEVGMTRDEVNTACRAAARFVCEDFQVIRRQEVAR